jgi:hypothetical protein
MDDPGWRQPGGHRRLLAKTVFSPSVRPAASRSPKPRVTFIRLFEARRYLESARRPKWRSRLGSPGPDARPAHFGEVPFPARSLESQRLRAGQGSADQPVGAPVPPPRVCSPGGSGGSLLPRAGRRCQCWCDSRAIYTPHPPIGVFVCRSSRKWSRDRGASEAGP